MIRPFHAAVLFSTLLFSTACIGGGGGGGGSSGGGGSGSNNVGATDPGPAVVLDSATLAGTTPSAATVLVNGLADQDASTTAWRRSITLSGTLASEATGSFGLLVTIDAGTAHQAFAIPVTVSR